MKIRLWRGHSGLWKTLNEEPERTPMERNPWLSRRGLLLYVVGFYLLLIVFLSPDAAHRQGRSILEVAQESPWDRWWDWAAAWCSVKIMLLGAGACSLIAALAIALQVLHRKFFSDTLFLLSAACSVGVWLGLYYLVKALL